jgi:hypothetical protein
MEVLSTIDEVIRHQQHLRTHQTKCIQGGVVVTHESTLSCCSQRLERRGIGGTLRQPECRNTSSHGTTGNYQHFMALAAQLRHLETQRRHHGNVDGPTIVGDR